MSYRVTRLRLDADRDAVTRLWSENMSDAGIAAVVPQRLSWLYEQGPGGGPQTMLCAADPGGEIVGCASYLPRAARLGDRPVRGAVLCDFAVSRAHRVLGPAVTLQRGLVEAARAAGIELLYGYPNAKSLPVFQRIGYRVVGSTEAWMKPLRSEEKLRRFGGGALARALAVPVDLGLLALDAARRVRAGGAGHAELAAEPDPGVEALWEAVRGGYGLAGERTTAYLAWRYGRFPAARFRFFSVHPDGHGRPAAVAVVSVAGTKAVLQDVFAERARVREAAVLLALGKALRREGVQVLVVSYLGQPSFGEELRAAGFLRRPGARPLVVHPDLLPADLRGPALDPARWHMLDGELDI